MAITKIVPGPHARSRPARRVSTAGGAIKDLARATQISLAKPTVGRKLPPLDWDISEFRDPAFVYDRSQLQRCGEVLSNVSPDKHGNRWVHGPAEVLYYSEYDVDYDYDDFVATIDVADVGFMFRDVLGIVHEVLRRDEQGRAVLQLGRIAALAQPNYTAFLGKKELDVYKLQYLERTQDAQRNWMRTVHSPNGSAFCDDGYLGFVRRPDGKTTITFLACQHFPIPRLMELARMDRIPVVKNLLTEVAYKLFFGKTVKNVVAAYEGRDYRIGRATRATRKGRRR